MFFLTISPDIVCNLTIPVDQYTMYQTNYLDHLSRFGGIGLNEQPLVFYFKSTCDILHIAYRDYLNFRSISLPMALTLLGSVAYTSFAYRQFRFSDKEDGWVTFLLLMFWCIFVFFSVIVDKSPSRGGVFWIPSFGIGSTGPCCGDLVGRNLFDRMGNKNAE